MASRYPTLLLPKRLILGDEAKVGFARGIVTEDRAGDCGRVDPDAAGDEVG